MSKPKYVQFSKKVVVAVTAAVTAISFAGITMAFIRTETAQITAIIKTYIEYAMVVFAAYSGNSAVEKWLISRNKTEDDEESSKG